MSKVFLGGTCNGSKWRELVIPFLHIDHYNPVVEDWTPECQEIEIQEKEVFCDIHLYVITSEMKGVFSIAETIESVMDCRKTTILHIDPTGFDEGQLRSLKAVVDMVKRHGGIAYVDKYLQRAYNVINYAFG
jgi:hypothetical protein